MRSFSQSLLFADKPRHPYVRNAERLAPGMIDFLYNAPAISAAGVSLSSFSV